VVVACGATAKICSAGDPFLSNEGEGYLSRKRVSPKKEKRYTAFLKKKYSKAILWFQTHPMKNKFY